jgi:hypothetical protein
MVTVAASSAAPASGRALVFTIVILAIYCLPILEILYACIASSAFVHYAGSVSFTHALSGGYLSFVRDSFGIVVVPLLTAYAAAKPSGDFLQSRERLLLLYILLGFFVIAILLYAIVEVHADAIKNYGDAYYDRFSKTTSTYAKELLTYVALVLGVSVNKH